MHLHFPCISIKRLCHFRKPIFPTAEMPLQISQNHFSTRRNAFVKFAKPFFHSPKCLCKFRKTIFPLAEMPLQISQNHFSTRRNAFVKFAKPFSSHFYYSVAFLREHQKIVSSIGRLSILFENTNFAPFRLYHPRMP